MFMKGTAGIMEPHYTGDMSLGYVTGGITFDIFATMANHYGVSFVVTYPTKAWIEINEDGSLGGSVGDVSFTVQCK